MNQLLDTVDSELTLVLKLRATQVLAIRSGLACVCLVLLSVISQNDDLPLRFTFGMFAFLMFVYSCNQLVWERWIQLIALEPLDDDGCLQLLDYSQKYPDVFAYIQQVKNQERPLLVEDMYRVSAWVVRQSADSVPFSARSYANEHLNVLSNAIPAR